MYHGTFVQPICCKNINEFDVMNTAITNRQQELLDCHRREQKISEYYQGMTQSHTHTYYRPNQGTARKRQRMITATWHSEHYKCIATSTPFPSEMIANLERTQSTVNQNKDLTLAPPPHPEQWEQRHTINNNSRTTTLERSAAKTTAEEAG